MSGEYRFLLKHSTIYGIGNILSKGISFALLPLYTRYLTPTDYGVMELVEITTGMIGVVLGIGVAQAISRFYYESEQPEYRARVVGTIYLMVILAAVAGFFVFSGAAKFLAELILESESYATIFVVSFASLAVGMVIDVGQVYWRVLQRSVLYITVSIVNMVIGIILNVVFVVYLEQGVLGIMYAGLITRCIVGIPVTISIISQIGLRWDSALAIDILRYEAPLIPSQLANTVVNYSDRYFINYFVSIQDAGIYGLANKLGTAIHILITSPFIMTFLPRRFEIVSRADAKHTLSKIYDYFLLVIVSAGLVLCVFTNELMVLMTTPDFYRAGALVPLIVLTMVVLAMRYHFEFGILYSKKTEYYMYINIVISIVHIAGNFVLVKSFGMWGAVYASLGAISLHSMLVYFVSMRLYRIDFDFIANTKLLAAAVSVYLLSTVHVSDHMMVTLAYKCILLCVFPLILLTWRVVSMGEIRKLKEITVLIVQKGRI